MFTILAITIASLYVVQWLLSAKNRKSSAAQHALAAAQRREEGKKTIDNLSQALDEYGGETARWTLDPVKSVADRVKRSKKECIALLNDILRRSLKSTRMLNNITEMPTTYEQLLKEVDALYEKRTSDDLNCQGSGLLQGLPISVKECVALQGTDSTAGTARRINEMADEDAVLIQVLKKQGALVYARTNIPQTMLSFECSNPIYGQTCNPYDLKRGPGGSSGGEGSLIGSFGSILGIGSDIGGSLRIPAAFSGCCGFKPTTGRISSRGMTSPVPGQEGIKSTSGPMAHEVDGLVLIMRAIMNDGLMHAIDPTIPNMPFNDEKYPHLPPVANNTATLDGSNSSLKKKLRIGWFDSDGFAPPVPSCKRAVDEARDALMKRGHELIEFDIATPKIGYEAMKMFALLIGADQGETLYEQNLHGEAVDPILEQLVFLITIPFIVRQFVATVSKVLGWSRVADLVGSAGRKTTTEVWAIQAEKKKLIQRTMDLWKAHKLDAIICPSGVLTAPPSGVGAELTPMCCYTSLFNVLDLPCGVVPTSYVTENDDFELNKYQKNDPWDNKVHQAAANSVGLPVAVQVAALPWEDEMCLHVMKELELAVNFTASGGLVNKD